jgi:hypothetical protein
MADEKGYRLEINYDPAMMTDVMKETLDKMVRKLGTALQIKCVMLANPDVLDVQFEEWADGGWKAIAAPAKEDEDAGS